MGPRRKVLLLLGAAVLLLLIGGRIATELVVELLWFRSLGLDRVFWTRWGAAVAVRVGIGLVVGAFVFANLWVVSRSLGTIRVRRRYGNIEIAERLPPGYLIGALGLIALFSGWWLSAAAAEPLAVLAAFRHAPWGAADPVFGRDLSFYVFVLPVLGGAQALAGVLLFWTALLAVVAYVATGAIRISGPRPSFSPATQRHLGLLLAGFLLVLAWDAWLDRYGLVLDGNGVGGAFGYTDAYARLPGQLALVAAALVAAAIVGYGAWRGTVRGLLGGVALLALALIGGRIAYPALVQKLSVEPNEFPRERRYIERHVEATLSAFGLDDLRVTGLPYVARDSAGLAAESLYSVLRGIPLWDPRPLQTAFEQKQSLFPYYDFPSVHLDRYGEGEAEQVAIAVRELIPTQLPATAQTWQNLHLNYVSGEGAVVSPVSRMAEDGAPVYYLSDLDPPKLAAVAPPELALTEPRVFFGQETEGYVILEPGTGPVGVPLNGIGRRLVFAWAFQSKNLLLSGEVGPRSLLVYRRSVLDRARSVAPFLLFTDDSAYPVILDGRVVWVLDGYSTTAFRPLAPLVEFGGERVRYVRNSAKVVVDGVTGAVRVYAVAPDPVLQTYARIFPGLVRPASEVPPELRRHLRFPPRLLALQAEILGEYHLSDPRDFYEKDDVWAVATENYRSESVPVSPTFVTLPLPGETRREFLLMVPFVSRGRQNMTALLVARNDPPNYGERYLYLLPRDELVPGPQQIESMIDQDPEISQELALWRRGGSEVIRGHLIVVPTSGTLVYAEPLYLEAANAAIPQLERVILAHAGRVVMRPTLAGAVAALTGETADPEPAGVAAGTGAPPGSAPTLGAETMRRARVLLERAEAQLRAGDWAGFGRTWEELKRALQAPSPPAGGPP